MEKTDVQKLLRESKKQTIVKVYVQEPVDCKNCLCLIGLNHTVLIGAYEEILSVIHARALTVLRVEYLACNSAFPLLDYTDVPARIEYGAIIRDQVQIGKNAIIMMGAVINLGAVIEEGAMIDMNAVIGSRAIVGAYSHIGAGAVLAGVLEPPNARPVQIGKRVLIGANAVVLGGIKVADDAVVGAGTIVTKDVASGMVVIGNPAHVIKKREELNHSVAIDEELRKLY